MSTQIFGPILPLQLDSRNVDDIVRAIQSRIFIESEGKLNDFTLASPLAAISEGQGFAQAELLYFLNTLPEAVTLQWLRALGIQRRIGSRAYADITFYKVPGYTRPVTIPKDTAVFGQSGERFTTLEQIVISDDSAVVRARSDKWGSGYNLGPNEITNLDRRFLGLDFVTNLEAAAGGTDLETPEQMKLRAFELLGRRNLTSRQDYESEVALLVPEATIVSVLPYSERFEGDSRGIFIVAGGDNGAPIPNSAQGPLLTSLRNRSPLDVKLYIVPPTILPVDVSIEVLWDPATTTTYTDTMAARVSEVIRDIVSPGNLGLGTSLSFTDVNKAVLSLEFTLDVPNLTIKELALDPDVVGGTDQPCGRFLGEQIEEDDRCLYFYKQLVDRSTGGEIVTSSPSSAFRLYRMSITLTSSGTFNTITYNYEDLYDIV